MHSAALGHHQPSEHKVSHVCMSSEIIGSTLITSVTTQHSTKVTQCLSAKPFPFALPFECNQEDEENAEDRYQNLKVLHSVNSPMDTPLNSYIP